MPTPEEIEQEEIKQARRKETDEKYERAIQLYMEMRDWLGRGQMLSYSGLLFGLVAAEEFGGLQFQYIEEQANTRNHEPGWTKSYSQDMKKGQQLAYLLNRWRERKQTEQPPT